MSWELMTPTEWLVNYRRCQVRLRFIPLHKDFKLEFRLQIRSRTPHRKNLVRNRGTAYRGKIGNANI